MDIGIFSLLLIILNLVISYRGFSNHVFFENYLFEIDKILVFKQYKRLISSGFLHVSWTHLAFNMLSLYAFSSVIEIELGGFKFLIIYFLSLIGGNLLALFIHRNHQDYSAVGASGAVSGIIFASIAIFPNMGIGFFLLPINIPSWLYAIVYIGYSIYGIKSSKDNIGHEAHLGGALLGVIVAIFMQPFILQENYVVISIILIPIFVFLYLIITKPHVLLIDSFFIKNHTYYYDIDHKYNEEKFNKQKEIDRILDKINKKGLSSLTNKEKQKLDELSS